MQQNPATKPLAAAKHETLELYGHAVLAIAGADGELSKRERDFLLEAGQQQGVPGEVLALWAKFDWQAADRKALVSRIRPLLTEAMARTLIYDAMRVARADGRYPLEERAAVEEAADRLGLDAHVVRSLRGLVEMEEALGDLRRGLLEIG